MRNGFEELSKENQPILIGMKYHSPVDAMKALNLQPAQIKDFYWGMQEMLYGGVGAMRA